MILQKKSENREKIRNTVVHPRPMKHSLLLIDQHFAQLSPRQCLELTVLRLVGVQLGFTNSLYCLFLRKLYCPTHNFLYFALNRSFSDLNNTHSCWGDKYFKAMQKILKGTSPHWKEKRARCGDTPLSRSHGHCPHPWLSSSDATACKWVWLSRLSFIVHVHPRFSVPITPLLTASAEPVCALPHITQLTQLHQTLLDPVRTSVCFHAVIL